MAANTNPEYIIRQIKEFALNNQMEYEYIFDTYKDIQLQMETLLYNMEQEQREYLTEKLNDYLTSVLL